MKTRVFEVLKAGKALDIKMADHLENGHMETPIKLRFELEQRMLYQWNCVEIMHWPETNEIKLDYAW